MKFFDLSPEELKNRVQLDLEFLHFLTNPFYIKFLLQHGYFEDENFLYYLKHLEYLKDDRIFPLVRYPIAFKMLENMQNKDFINWFRENPEGIANFLQN